MSGVLYTTWGQVNTAVRHLAAAALAERITDDTVVYGQPRGGLVLAVMLSHALDIHLTRDLGFRGRSDTIFVDDIIDSGKTLEGQGGPDGFHSVLCMFKKRGMPVEAWVTLDENEWICFPWENRQNVDRDYLDYMKRRGLK